MLVCQLLHLQYQSQIRIDLLNQRLLPLEERVVVIWLVATEPDDRPEKATLFAGDITSNDGEPPSSYASLIAASICASVSARSTG